MDDFYQWLFGTCQRAEDRSKVHPLDQELVVPGSIYEEKTTENKEKEKRAAFSTDINILTQTYGELKPGMEIEIELNKACDLLGRQRRRTDAFKGLQNFLLQDYNVTLIITSRKNKRHG